MRGYPQECFAAVAAFTALLLGSTSGVRPAGAADPVWRHSPERGFIEDCFAFDATGERLAYLHTDSATFLRARVVSTASGELISEIPLDVSHTLPRSLAFTPDGSHLILLFSDTRREGCCEGRSEAEGAALLKLSSAAKVGEIVGASEVALVPFAGNQVLSSIKQRGEAAGPATVSLTLHDTTTLRKVAQAAVALDAAGRVAGTSLKLLYWGPGKTSFVALEPGKYDPKTDVRLPDMRVRYDVVQRRVISRSQPENPVLWRQVLQMRERHPQQQRFVQVSDDLKHLLFVDENDGLRTLKTARPWKLYGVASLRQDEPWDGSRLFVSLTVDPVNPIALERQKAFPERADFYEVKPGGELTLLGHAMVEKRDFAWASNGAHIVYLRKLRGFTRGGKTLELYAASTPDPPVKPISTSPPTPPSSP